jgi:predicted transport protein
MSDLKVFRISDGIATAMPAGLVTLERHLQTVIERNMETLFGVRFLASEFSTGARHGGRIDSLGLDENGSPVIFEYKRSKNENVINQGLFYLDWLLDHHGDFTVLVQKQLGSEAADEVDWSSPRLVCVASDFTRYDEHAVSQMGRSIELVRYQDFEAGSYLALDLVASTAEKSIAAATPDPKKPSSKSDPSTVTAMLKKASERLTNLNSDLDTALTELGDDVTVTTRKFYFAYRRIKNFACVEVHPSNDVLLIYAKVDPDTVDLVEGFTRDVRKVGHYGTGDLEIKIRNSEDLDRALPLLEESYNAS